MNRHTNSRGGVDVCPVPDNGPSDDSKPKIEPDEWRDLKEFVERCGDDAVFEVQATLDDGSERFWIVRDIEKVRPAAVPIEQGPTFDLDVLGPNGDVVNEIQLTLEKIEQVRAAEPSDGRNTNGGVE